MNLSGQAVVDLLQFYKIEPQDLLVIVDEVQLELGRLRARPSGSAGGHNGLKSIIGVLGTDDVPAAADRRGTRRHAPRSRRITCWRDSSRTNGRSSTTRCSGRLTPPKRSSGKGSSPR